MAKLKYSENLFWDADPEKLDSEKNKRYIIRRVFERGTLSDIREMLSCYTLPVVADEVVSFRSLPPKVLSFISCVAQIPREKFECYTPKQSSTAPWIY